MEQLELTLPQDEQSRQEILNIIETLQLWNISTPQQSVLFQKILPYMNKMLVSGLYISVFDFPLPLLCAPIFTLTTLNLNGCQLTTIECISRLQMPNLTTLDLSPISLTKATISLRKATFPALTSLRLQENPVKDLRWLSELRSNSQSFILFIEEFYNQPTVEDLSPVAKLQPIIRKLFCEAEGRIPQSIFWRKLTNMNSQYPPLKIYKYISYGVM